LEYRKVGELVQAGIIFFNEETRKLVMRNRNMTHRNYGKSLVQAVERIANTSVGPSAPRVMLGFLGLSMTPWEDHHPAVQTFYQDYQRAQIQEALSMESEARAETSSDEEGSSYFKGVYLTSLQLVATEPRYVQPAEHTDTTVQKARRQIFDGVYPPTREKRKAGEMKDLHGSKEESRTHNRGAKVIPDSHPMPHLLEQADVPIVEEVPIIAGPPAQSPPMVTPEKASKAQERLPPSKTQLLIPEVQPVNTRRARFADGEDEEMPEARGKEKAIKGARQKGSGNSEESLVNVDKGVPRSDGTTVSKPLGQQSELTGTVDQKGVLNRILDMQVPMLLREIMVMLKEISTEI
jgi:hypothetical protein